MDERIETWIEGAERKWLKELYTNALRQFSGTFLPSHDHTHHLRVWNICKQLLRAFPGHYEPSDDSLAEGLLIAAFFHDLGMIRSNSEQHGLQGKEMCKDYFRKENKGIPKRFPEILEAIELHDRKVGELTVRQKPGALPGIPEILSLADDMEAMGNIGIYRYTEIYLQRDAELRTLGIRILGNAYMRYRKMAGSCTPFPGILRSWHGHYLTLVSFFNHYNHQLMAVEETENVFSGHLGVVNYIRSFSVKGKTAPVDFPVQAEAAGAGIFVIKFFKALNDELEKARN